MCVIVLTLATTLAGTSPAREPPRIALVRREAILQARDPLSTETGTPADRPRDRRPSLRATVFLPGQTVLYVTETPAEVMLRAPCLLAPTPPPSNPHRVEAERRPPP